MKKQSFEEKLAYSKEILEKLMHPDITLESSLKLYEEGLQNIKESQNLIEKAKIKIAIIEQSKQEVSI